VPLVDAVQDAGDTHNVWVALLGSLHDPELWNTRYDVTGDPVPAVVQSSEVCDRSLARMYCEPPQFGVPTVAGAVHVRVREECVVVETARLLTWAGTVCGRSP
jgi:hypothetical protein